MANAAILKTGDVIIIDNLLSGSVKFDLDGYISEFCINDIQKKYIHARKDEFRLQDVNDTDITISAGYYVKNEFLNYLANKISIKDLNNFKLKNSEIVFAKHGDIISVIKVSVIAPYEYFYKIQEIKFPYNKNTKIIDFNDNIIIPTNATSNVFNINTNISNTASQFYTSRIGLVNNFIQEEKDAAALLITKIGLMINMISFDIFPFFIEVGDTNYSSYVTNQINEWNSGNILSNPSLKILNEYYYNLISYYRVAYSNQLKIVDSTGVEKLYYLAIAMSAEGLSVLSPNDKWELLNYLIKNKLSDNLEKLEDERLVIKIISSFNSTNLNEISSFLNKFLEIYVGLNMTFYEVLYRRMSTSTNLKSGLIALSNSWFGSSFKPTTTRSDFVQAMYTIWYFSDNNPYKLDGSIRDQVLGFRSLNNQVASFTANLNINDYKFKYTHHTAYVKESSDVPNNHFIRYKELYPESAPMVIPYESDKIIGIYFDNFNFKIEGKKIKMYQSLTVGGGNSQYSSYDEMDVLFGTYDIFQPVSLLNTNIETKSAISTSNGEDIEVNGHNINSFIPTFVLAHIDAEGDRSDVETMIGYTVDVATTFTGIGSLSKLKHLRWASSGLTAGETALFSMNGLRIVVGGVEFTSGVLGFLANFVECGPDDTFCKSLKTFIASLQIASLSVHAGDGLASLAMKVQAGKVIRVAGGDNQSEIINNLRARLTELNVPNASTGDIDNLANAIYQSGVLYSTPVHLLAINLYEKLKKTYLLAQNKLYRNVYRLEDTPLNIEVDFNQMPRFSLYKYVEVIPPGNIWKRISDGDNYLHTEVELQEMIDKGIELQIDELSDSKFKADNEVTQHFILKSFRTAKQKTKLEVFNQMETFKIFLTTRNKVPFCFSLSNNAIEFLNFKSEFLAILGRFDYGNDIRILKYLDEYQITGSALYRTDPPDMDISGYIRRMHIRKLTEKNIELFNKNKKKIKDQLKARGRKDYEFEKIEKAILKANSDDQISAYALLRIDSEGNIYSLAEDISNMSHKPNTSKSTDFNLFDVNNPERRLQPDLTIKTN